MPKVLIRRSALWLLVALALTGCFRQAGPDVDAPISTVPPTLTPTQLPSPMAGDVTPFITPFAPGEGPELTSMPTLAGPEPTLSFIQPGEAVEVTATPGGGAAIPRPTGTIPFAAGPTYTPVPGAPPVNLNPNLPGAAQTSLSTPVQPAEDCIYEVEPGDTAFYIASKYNITLAELIEYNQLENANYLYEGQELKIPNCGVPVEPTVSGLPTANIPAPGPTPTSPIPATTADGQIIHVVEPGQNLFRISLRYGVTVQDIVDANNLGSANAILSIGQQLIIPTTGD